MKFIPSLGPTAHTSCNVKRRAGLTTRLQTWQQSINHSAIPHESTSHSVQQITTKQHVRFTNMQSYKLATVRVGSNNTLYKQCICITQTSGLRQQATITTAAQLLLTYHCHGYALPSILTLLLLYL